MQLIRTTSLNPDQKESVYKLWNGEYPDTITFVFPSQLDTYLNHLEEPEHYLLIDEEEAIIAWALTFKREDEKWFAIIINQEYHKKGLGTNLLNRIKESENELNGWVVDMDSYTKRNGSPYISPLPFYLKNGFKIVAGQRLELPQMSAIKIQWKAS